MDTCTRGAKLRNKKMTKKFKNDFCKNDFEMLKNEITKELVSY